MTNVTINDYIALGTLDRTLLEHKQKYALLQRKKDSHQQALLQETHLFEQQERTIHQRKMAALALEKEIKDLDQQLALKKKKREHIASHKEFASIEHELALLQQKRESLDEQLLQEWEALEAQTTTFKELKARHQQLVHDTEKEVQTLSAQQEAEQGLISSLEEQRHKALVKLPAEWVARYSSLLQQVPNPYVPVINGICSGCSYAVLQKDLIDLRAHRMVYCKECYRLLYLEQG